jgi:hypothetical protein
MKIAGLMVFALGTFVGLALFALSQSQPQISGGTTAVKQVGAIKSIAGSVIVLAPDAGSELSVLVQDSTRIVRIAPGEKDLKNATSISLHDLQPGDRILVRGKSADAGQLVASGIIAMKLSDLEIRQQREREDWQKRGVAGLVSGVDATSDTITVSIGSLAGKKSVVIHTTKATVVRRYAPDSVRFDDARASTLAQIKPGDQLRARGTRNAGASELIAEEIVSGSFRNIAGTVGSVDASSGTVTVLDLATKKPVVVKVTGDSELRNLPPEVAKRLAMRMMGAGAPPGGAASTGAFRRETMGPEGEGPAGGQQRRGDIQQMFNHLPPLSVPEMQKGDTVMLVATEGTSTGAVTAIKLLDGVEPILARSPKNGGEIMTLSPWNLGGQGGEDASP